MRLLIDECLSYRLVAIAHEFGYEAHHVAHLNLAGMRDRDLIDVIIAGDFTFVTNNAADFRKLYVRLNLHGGLILILGRRDRLEQQTMFRAILSRVAVADLVNTVLEADIAEGQVRLTIRELP